MSQAEQQYLDLMRQCLAVPVHDDRTGTGRKSIFGHQMRFDLSKGFPLLTTKRVFWKGVVAELLWFLAGETNNFFLERQGVHIWDEWAGEGGELGRIYGHQWRRFGRAHIRIDEPKNGLSVHATHVGFDQIKWVINEIKTNPNSSRLIVSSWNPHDHCVEGRAALPPCHTLFQFFVSNGKLSCQLYQRSADVFLGVPFNIASYSLLTHLVAHVCDLDVGEFVWTGGDCHLYANHETQACEQLSRDPRPFPALELRADTPTDIFNISADHIGLTGYDPHPAIKADVAV